jgi:hypothetical protein
MRNQYQRITCGGNETPETWDVKRNSMKRPLISGENKKECKLEGISKDDTFSSIFIVKFLFVFLFRLLPRRLQVFQEYQPEYVVKFTK